MYSPLLDTLLQVEATGSFTQAAKKLYITTVSVMNQMNTLEKQVGVPLFVRTHQGVELTPAGKALCRSARKIIADSQAALAEARRLGQQEQQVIRIGTSILRPCRPLMDRWAQVADGTLPFRIQVVPFEDDPVSLEAMVKSLGKKIDCFVGPCDSAQWEKDCGIQVLTRCPCLIALPRQHPLTKKQQLTWQDLAGETLLLVKQGQSPVLDQLRREILTRQPNVRIQDLENFYDMNAFNTCAQKGYLMEVPDIWANVHPSLVTLPMTWNYAIPFGIVHAKTPGKVFLRFLKVLEGKASC